MSARIDIVSDSVQSAGDGDSELIKQLLGDSDDVQSVLNKLSRLEGQWPFQADSQCNTMDTRDHDYHSYIKRDDTVTRLLHRVPRCGLAKLPADDNRQTGSKQLSRDRVSRDTGRKRDWHTALKELESLVDKWMMFNSSSQAGHLKSQSSRVVGGTMTRNGAWPWLAAVGRKTSGPKCGGSLIADRWVITAAHCFQDKEMPCTYNVRLGSRSWFYDPEGTHVDATVEAIYRHPDYDQDTHVNDVALLKLSTIVELNEDSHINALCLPAQSRSVEPGTVCVAAGWGKTAEDSKASVYESRQVDIPVITYTDKCGHYASGTLHRGMLCAGYLKGGHDTCQGDSGGPLTFERDGRWTLLGLTSFGEGCARAHYPGIYTDVGYHLNWISSVIDRF